MFSMNVTHFVPGFSRKNAVVFVNVDKPFGVVK